MDPSEISKSASTSTTMTTQTTNSKPKIEKPAEVKPLRKQDDQYVIRAFLEAQHRCPICWTKELVDPVVTVCKHVYCRECIVGMCKLDQLCPVCRQRIVPKSGGIGTGKVKLVGLVDKEGKEGKEGKKGKKGEKGKKEHRDGNKNGDLGSEVKSSDVGKKEKVRRWMKSGVNELKRIFGMGV